jgi:hypothetical protein
MKSLPILERLSLGTKEGEKGREGRKGGKLF